MSLLKKPKRAYLFWVFVGIAIPLTIGVLGYTAGYRIDNTAKTIIKTSALSVYSKPTTVNVHINDALVASATPYISTFPAGSYAVRVEREGYYPWRAIAEIDEDTAISFAHIQLFPQSIPASVATLPEDEDHMRVATPEERAKIKDLKMSETDAVRILSSSGHSMIVNDTKKYIAVYAKGQTTPIAEFSGDFVAGEWLNDEALIATHNELFIVNTSSEERTLITRTTRTLTDATFFPTGTHIIYSDLSGIFATEVYPNHAGVTTQLLASENVDDLHIARRPYTLYFLLNLAPMSLALE